MNLNQITIPSLNVPQSIAFYKKLGLRLIVHTHDAYARFECTDGDTTFSIHKVEQLAEGPGIYIYFEVKNVAETVANCFRSNGDRPKLAMDGSETERPGWKSNHYLSWRRE